MTRQIIFPSEVAEITLSYHGRISKSAPTIHCSSDAAETFRCQWNEGTLGFVEEFKILLLNRGNRVLGIVQISRGGITGTVADPKLIFANWFDFFSDFVGVTRKDDEAVDVKLVFSKEQAPYIITKPLHGTQNHTMNDDGTLEVTINDIPNFELESLILSFGERVKVLEPESLREAIVGRIHESQKNY